MNKMMCVFTLLLAMPVPSPQQSQRILHLENILLSPCCYTQAVALHPSDVAVAMRSEIAGMVLTGQSDRQIVDHYKALYGERILIEPEGETRTVLYSLPFTSALTGLLLVMLFLHRCLRKKSTLPGLGPARCGELDKYRKKVQATLREYEGIGME